MRRCDVHVSCGSDDAPVGALHDDEGQTRATLLRCDRLRDIVVHVRERLDRARLEAPELGLEAHTRERGCVRESERLERDDRSVK